MDADTLRALNYLHEENRILRSQVAELQRNQGERMPETGLLSPNYWRRAATVWGYCLVGYIGAVILAAFLAMLLANAGYTGGTW